MSWLLPIKAVLLYILSIKTVLLLLLFDKTVFNRLSSLCLYILRLYGYRSWDILSQMMCLILIVLMITLIVLMIIFIVEVGKVLLESVELINFMCSLSLYSFRVTLSIISVICLLTSCLWVLYIVILPTESMIRSLGDMGLSFHQITIYTVKWVRWVLLLDRDRDSYNIIY